MPTADERAAAKAGKDTAKDTKAAAKDADKGAKEAAKAEKQAAKPADETLEPTVTSTGDVVANGAGELPIVVPGPAAGELDETPRYADGTEVTDDIDSSTRMSSIGMNPSNGEGNGDPNAEDSSTAAPAPEVVQAQQE